MPSLIDRYLGQRAELATSLAAIEAPAVADDRDLTDEEQASADALVRQAEEVNARLDPLLRAREVIDRHRDTVATIAQPQGAATAPTGLTAQPRTVEYKTAGDFLVDLVRSISIPGDSAGLPRYSADAAQRVAVAMGRAAGSPETQTTLTDVPGVLPVSIVGPIWDDMDAARPLVNAVGARDLGGIPGVTFNRPFIATRPDQGTGRQPAELAEGQGGELKIQSLPFTKESFLRWMEVGMQTIDWTSPAAWNVLMGEFMNAYALDTEIAAETKLLAGVDQSETVTADDYPGWVHAFYAAQMRIVSAGGDRRRGVLRVPDLIVTSLDMDASIGALIDIAVAQAQKVEGTPLGRFGGILVQTPRIMAPMLPAGTVLFGRKAGYEFYEQRKGFLQEVEPKVMGVVVAYGGYAAMGHMDPTLWCKITPAGD